MVRTQIQIPDELYERLKALSDRQEWSMAETVRRGAELLLRCYPTEAEPGPWDVPKVDVGPVLAPVERWRAIANEGA